MRWSSVGGSEDRSGNRSKPPCKGTRRRPAGLAVCANLRIQAAATTALMMRSLHEALRGSGAADEKARPAAEEAASYDNRLSPVGSKLAVLTWMVGTATVLTLAVFGVPLPR